MEKKEIREIRKRTDQIDEEIDSEFNIFAIIDGYKVYEKIIELNFDEDIIRDWIEDTLTNL